MEPLPNEPLPDIDWPHVGIGLSFVIFNSIISHVLQLHVGASLVIASIRCMAQLTVMATIFQSVFDTKSLWAVAGIAGTSLSRLKEGDYHYVSWRSQIDACTQFY
jgi:ABC-type iron transport system FetAB permease component